MLLDKSGLRKKGTIPSDPSKTIKSMTNKETKDYLKMFGIGTESSETETDEQKAERIRNELNK
jgi:hypothetical protein